MTQPTYTLSHSVNLLMYVGVPQHLARHIPLQVLKLLIEECGDGVG